MSPQRFVPEDCDPEKLRTLQQVFDSTWDAVTREHPDRDTSKDEARRELLAKLLVLSAEEGVTDPVTLKDMAAETMELALSNGAGLEN
jgi:hypothetical protein